MEEIASVLRPKFLPYTLEDAVNDACDSLISIINVRRQQLIDLIKVREQEMADIKTCKDRAHLEFFEADRLYETSCNSPWYIPKKVPLPAPFEAILHKNVFEKERRAYGEFKLSVKCDKNPFRTILNEITDVYLEVLNPDIMKYQHDTSQQHGIIGTGTKGSNVGQYDNPSDIAYCNITEELFIADSSNHRIVICNGAGEYIRQIGGRDVMKYPCSIAVTPECIYIGARDAYDKVGEYPGKLLKYSRITYQVLNQVNLASGKYSSIPSSLAVHANNNLYVGGMCNDRISIYSADLAYIQHFYHSMLKNVIGLILKDDMMYVLVIKDHCVLIFSSTYPHQYITSIISSSDVTYGLYFCMDRYNNIIISDYSSHNIKIFSPHGKLLNTIGKYGKKLKGGLWDPTGISVTNKDAIICVNENSNYYIQIFY